jgi:hypothetical protein
MKNKIRFIPVSDEALLNPPEPAKFNLPSWYKDLETVRPGSSFTAEYYLNARLTPFTVKKCIPVLDYLTNGYVLKFPYDVLVTQNEFNGVKSFSWKSNVPSKDVVQYHMHDQCPAKMGDVKSTFIKFSSDWIIETPVGYSCYFSHPFFEEDTHVSMLPAVVDTDVYDRSLNFPAYISTNEKEFYIKAGSPMICVFPFKRENWGMEIAPKVVDENNSKMAKLERTYLEGAYRKFMHKKKRFD